MKKVSLLAILAASLWLGSALAGTTATTATTATSGLTGCMSEAHYPLITKSELKKVASDKEAVIFDVNSKESYAKAHVPGAIHYESHEADFATLLPQDKDGLIVAYCGGVMCTAWKKAAQAACKLGYTNIRHYKEGITGWVKSD